MRDLSSEVAFFKCLVEPVPACSAQQKKGRHLHARKSTMNRKLKMRNCLRRISDKFPSQFPRPDVGSKVAGSRLSFSLYVRSSYCMLVKMLALQKLKDQAAFNLMISSVCRRIYIHRCFQHRKLSSVLNFRAFALAVRSSQWSLVFSTLLSQRQGGLIDPRAQTLLASGTSGKSCLALGPKQSRCVRRREIDINDFIRNGVQAPLSCFVHRHVLNIGKVSSVGLTSTTSFRMGCRLR